MTCEPLSLGMDERKNIYSLLDLDELAKGECRSVEWIESCKRAGYEFSDGAVTSLHHLRDWLRANPNFRAKHYPPPPAPRVLPEESRRVVYFIEAQGLGLIKIGVATDSAAYRLGAMQTGCPVPLILKIEFRGGRDVERSYHKRFKSLRYRGEWFKKEGELRQFIRSAGYFYRRRLRRIAEVESLR